MLPKKIDELIQAVWKVSEARANYSWGDMTIEELEEVEKELNDFVQELKKS